jgi:hypothetical protein
MDAIMRASSSAESVKTSVQRLSPIEQCFNEEQGGGLGLICRVDLRLADPGSGLARDHGPTDLLRVVKDTCLDGLVLGRYGHAGSVF